MCRLRNYNSRFNFTLQSWPRALDKNTNFPGLWGYELQSLKNESSFFSIDNFSYLEIINHFEDYEYYTRDNKMFILEISLKYMHECGC